MNKFTLLNSARARARSPSDGAEDLFSPETWPIDPPLPLEPRTTSFLFEPRREGLSHVDDCLEPRRPFFFLFGRFLSFIRGVTGVFVRETTCLGQFLPIWGKRGGDIKQHWVTYQLLLVKTVLLDLNSDLF